MANSQAIPDGPRLPAALLSATLLLRPVPFLERCAKRYGDHFTLRLGGGRAVVVSSEPELVRDVFAADPELLRAGAGREASPLLPLLGAHSVLFLDGPGHRRQRRLVAPALHGERITSLSELVTQATREELARWPAGAAFPSLPAMRRITLEVVLRAVFGADDPAARRQLGTALAAVLDFATRPLRSFQLELADPHGRARINPWRRLRLLTDRLDGAVHEQIAARRRDPRAADRPDVLSTLLQTTDEQGWGLSDRALRDQLVSLAIAGHEKTASALSWALERISSRPDVLSRLVGERNEERASAPFLEATIAETLRLRPVVPALARRVTADTRLGSLDLPAGVVVAPSVYLLHRRPDVYPKPDEFRPERFLHSPPDSAAWIPFGGGPRRCMGAALVRLQMAGILGQIVASAELQPAIRRPERVSRRAITHVPRRGGVIRVGRTPTARVASRRRPTAA